MSWPKLVTDFHCIGDGWNAGMLSVLEPHVGLVCACLPTIRPLFWRNRTQASSQSQSTSFVSWRPNFLRSSPQSGHQASSVSSRHFNRLPPNSADGASEVGVGYLPKEDKDTSVIVTSRRDRLDSEHGYPLDVVRVTNA